MRAATGRSAARGLVRGDAGPRFGRDPDYRAGQEGTCGVGPCGPRRRRAHWNPGIPTRSFTANMPPPRYCSSMASPAAPLIQPPTPGVVVATEV